MLPFDPLLGPSICFEWEDNIRQGKGVGTWGLIPCLALYSRGWEYWLIHTTMFTGHLLWPGTVPGSCLLIN